MAAIAMRLRDRTAAVIAQTDRMMSNPFLIGLIAAVSIAIMLSIYLRHSPRIFDISLSDETIYLGAGILPKPSSMNSYESGGLYSLFYRFLSFFIGDPVDLYLRGGVI